MTEEFLASYPAKAAEYLLAVGYLLLFIPFWRYVQGAPREARARVRVGEAVAAAAALARHAGATALAPVGAAWFHAPPGVHLHPGHSWARLEPDGTVSVGIDDFGHKLVGPAEVALPAVGAAVAQGEPALALREGGREVPVLSPVDGTVVAVNGAARETSRALEDPYGAGWLFRVKPPRLAANLHQLHAGERAKRLLEDAAEALAARMSPELGRVLQDGGTPVHGIARELEGERWDALARKFFLA